MKEEKGKRREDKGVMGSRKMYGSRCGGRREVEGRENKEQE